MKSLQYINSIIASKKDLGLLVFRIFDRHCLHLARRAEAPERP